MLGGAISKIVKYAVAGALAMVLGSQLITSVSEIVLAYKMGNALPVIVIFLLTLILLRLADSQLLASPMTTIMNVLSWGAVVYLFVTVFFITLQSGLWTAILGSAAVLVICGIVRNPTKFRERVEESLHADLNVGYAIPAKSSSNISDSEMWSYVHHLAQTFRLIVIPKGTRTGVVEIMKSRPRLNICLQCLLDIDILLFDQNLTSVEDLLQLLEESGIQGCYVGSNTLTMTVLAVPLIEERHGHLVSDYVLVTEEKSVEVLLRTPTPGTMIFSNSDGVQVVVQKERTTGLKVEVIPPRRLHNIVVHKKNPEWNREREEDDDA